METELMTLREALDIFHSLGHGSQERQLLALQILTVLDRSSLESVTWAKVPSAGWVAVDQPAAGRVTSRYR